MLYSELPLHRWTSIKDALALLQTSEHLLQAEEKQADMLMEETD